MPPQGGRNSLTSSVSPSLDPLAAGDHQQERSVDDFEAAKRYADSHGIKIYNATRGGNLEVFERVDFDSLPFIKKKTEE